jgi:hypothetical protein
MLRRMLGGTVAALALFSLGAAQAADFTQPARDPKFIQSARRQDKELGHYWGRLIPAGTQFNHLGSFQARVHRTGMERPVTLVPVASLAYGDSEALRAAGRAGDVVVGALKVTYGMHEPEIMPGTLLLVYDGLRVHLRNIHGEDISSFDATLAAAPQGSIIDPALGKLGDESSSLAAIRPDGTLELYLQLTENSGKRLVGLRGGPGNTGYSKVLLSFRVPGLVEDDDSPSNKLVTPKQEEKKAKPAKVYGK